VGQDWQRGRYLWARVGYERVFKDTEGGGGPSVAEDRGVLPLWGKVPLPGGVWLENRARVDLRWIGGEYSTRYRLRVEATREFSVAGHAIVPYERVRRGGQGLLLSARLENGGDGSVTHSWGSTGSGKAGRSAK
jgi:hypothetical protein